MDGDILAIRLMDKRLVFMLSSIHAAEEVHVKDTFAGDPIWKPTCVDDYNQKMRGVDLADQFLSYYTPLRKCLKWSTKMHHHLFNMAIFNAYRLYKEANPRAKENHFDFRISIILSLLRDAGVNEYEYHTLHMPSQLPPTNKREAPYRRCHRCMQTGILGKNFTNMWCQTCQIPLCIKRNCFSLYHKEHNLVEMTPSYP